MKVRDEELVDRCFEGLRIFYLVKNANRMMNSVFERLRQRMLDDIIERLG